MRIPPAANGAYAYQAIGGKAQRRLVAQLGVTDEFGLGHSAHRFDAAKDLIDELAHPQALAVSLVSIHALVNDRVFALVSHMGRDVELSATLDECLAVAALVGTDRGLLALSFPSSQHGQRGFSL